MKQEIYERLIPFEDIFDRAVNQNFFRALATEHKKQLHELYNQVFGGGSKIANGCGTCTLNNLKQLGEEYFKYKAQLEASIATSEELATGGTTICTESVVLEEPKKKGRPRKNS